MKQAPANHRVLLMDYYALTMAQSHFSQGRQHEIAYFDYFFRTVPDHGGYAIFAGLTQVLDYLEFLHFTPDDIAFLRSKGVFTAEFLDYLANFRFRGDVRAVPEGSVVFPHEPLLTVRAPLIDCQLIETYLLLTLNHQSRIATKAARMRSVVVPPAALREDPRWSLANVKLDDLTQLTAAHLLGDSAR